ncbi:hypothetical protein KDX24_27035 [Pseudomonas sp. CDFA 550]|nr:hypothetical protein [Pseudomonas quasicaspiana]
MPEICVVNYKIEAFDNETKFLAFEVVVPKDCDARLARIMRWSKPQRGDEGYDISAEQAAAIEALIGSPFYDDRHIFQITCNIE